MPTPRSHEQGPMCNQPSAHASTVPTQSLPKMPGEPKSAALHQKQLKPDEEELRTARLRETIRLDALKKQREAMKLDKRKG